MAEKETILKLVNDSGQEIEISIKDISSFSFITFPEYKSKCKHPHFLIKMKDGTEHIISYADQFKDLGKTLRNYKIMEENQ